jgi:tRNA pseudouridine38-40 synthase
VLESRDRARAGQTAPPVGLTFLFVRYAEEIGWT